jgi:hypothetical protein
MRIPEKTYHRGGVGEKEWWELRVSGAKGAECRIGKRLKYICIHTAKNVFI